jgi:hypothetical protein
MSQRRQLREYQLVQLMLNDRQAFHEEYRRVTEQSGRAVPQCFTDRDMVQTILAIEFHQLELSQSDPESEPMERS